MNYIYTETKELLYIIKKHPRASDPLNDEKGSGSGKCITLWRWRRGADFAKDYPFVQKIQIIFKIAKIPIDKKINQ